MTRIVEFIRRFIKQLQKELREEHLADSNPRQQNHANLPPLSRGNRMPR